MRSGQVRLCLSGPSSGHPPVRAPYAPVDRLVAKVLAGTLAVAAAGGAAIAAIGSPSGREAAAVAGAAQPVEEADRAVSSEVDIGELVATAHRTAENAHRLGEAMQAWARCVSAEAEKHGGAGFNLLAACGPRPSPVDYGLGSATPDHAAGAGSRDVAGGSGARTGGGVPRERKPTRRPGQNPGREDSPADGSPGHGGGPDAEKPGRNGNGNQGEPKGETDGGSRDGDEDSDG